MISSWRSIFSSWRKTPKFSSIEAPSSSRIFHGPLALACGRAARSTRARRRRCADSGTVHGPCCESAHSAAARPARRPKVIVSISELPPRRFAPWTRDARALAGRVEALELALAVDVRVDAAHVVVSARPDGDRRRRSGRRPRRSSRARASPAAASRIFSAPRWRRSRKTEPLTPRPCVDLGLLGARDDVARGELHRLGRVAWP